MNISQNGAIELGHLETVKRDIRSQKRRHLHQEPRFLAEVVIHDQYRQTAGLNPQEFLFYDSGVAADDNMLIFGSENALTWVGNATTWHMDETFSVAPNICKQLFFIRAPLGTSAVSCVYAFIPGKMEVHYTEMLNEVVSRCRHFGTNPSPTNVVMDFEKGAINAARNTLNDNQIKITGCFLPFL